MQSKTQSIKRVAPAAAAKLLNLSPNDPSVRFYRAVGLFEAGKTKAAIKEFFELASLGIPAAAAYAVNYKQQLTPAERKQLSPIKGWYEALEDQVGHKIYLQISKDIAKINKPAGAAASGGRARKAKKALVVKLARDKN